MAGADHWARVGPRGAGQGDLRTSIPVVTLSEGARLVSRLAGAELLSRIDVDVRHTSVRLTADEAAAHAIDEALDLPSLGASRAGTQRLGVVIRTPHPEDLSEFWHLALGYDRDGDVLSDPLRRTPCVTISADDSVSLEPVDGPWPRRNRLHIDACQPPEIVDRLVAMTGVPPKGAWGVLHRDADSNALDLVPSDDLLDGTWQTLFSAQTTFRSEDSDVLAQLCGSAAGAADALGFPLRIDIRGDRIVFDSGKDLWEEHPAFSALAEQIVAEGARAGLRPDPEPARYLQIGIDAVDVPGVRSFWSALLGYQNDPRDAVTDITDPLGGNPVLFFLQIAESDHHAGLAGRIGLELAVDRRDLTTLVAAARAAGGTATESEHGAHITDPEGAGLTLATA